LRLDQISSNNLAQQTFQTIQIDNLCIYLANLLQAISNLTSKP